ncbi:MltA-interacting MipA family protein [Enterobacter cloacae]|uniref:MltA-interacting MipA family protein n=1 Tax=Enterobacter cloacae TaxID=550 RepID=A0A377M2C7_ENTCL|nr:MltA-interacting MipA family protein [Enterobacter cloacae]
MPGALLALLATPVLASEQQGNVLTLGGGVDVAPRYSGSDKNRATTAVVVDYAMYNGFFVSTTRGIGYGNNIGNLDYSAALSYRAGRKDRDVDSDSISGGSDYLRGMGRHQRFGSGGARAGVQSDRLAESAINRQRCRFRSETTAKRCISAFPAPLFTSPNNAVTLSLTGSLGQQQVHADLLWGECIPVRRIRICPI